MQKKQAFWIIIAFGEFLIILFILASVFFGMLKQIQAAANDSFREPAVIEQFRAHLLETTVGFPGISYTSTHTSATITIENEALVPELCAYVVTWLEPFHEGTLITIKTENGGIIRLIN